MFLRREAAPLRAGPTARDDVPRRVAQGEAGGDPLGRAQELQLQRQKSSVRRARREGESDRESRLTPPPVGSEEARFLEEFSPRPSTTGLRDAPIRERIRPTRERGQPGIPPRPALVPALPNPPILSRHRPLALFHRSSRVRPHLGQEAEREAAPVQGEALLGVQRAPVQGVQQQQTVELDEGRGWHVEERRGKSTRHQLHPQTSDQDVQGHRPGEERIKERNVGIRGQRG